MVGEASESNEQVELPLDAEPCAEPGARTPKKEHNGRLAIVYSGPRTNLGMNRKTTASTVDRLIALATDGKPAEPENAGAEGTTNLGALSMFGDPKLRLSKEEVNSP